MTTKERLISMLVKNGMFESQATQVMELAMPELAKQADGYLITFDGRADQYPDVLYQLWFTSMRPVVLAWIDEHAPQAWYRLIFV